MAGPISKAALQVLNSLSFDPNATNNYEHLAGGLLWTDELPKHGTPEWDAISEDFLFRILIAARHDITLGESSPRFQEIWHQVEMYAPSMWRCGISFANSNLRNAT